MRRVQHGRARLGWVVGGTLATVLVAVLVCEATGWRFLRSPLQNAIAKATGADVEIGGRFRTHLIFSPGLSAEHVRIDAKPGFNVAHLVDATGLQLNWSWADLWRWRRGDTLHVRRVQAQTLDANLIRRADGSATWQFGEPKSDDTPRDKPMDRPRVGLLHIGQGDVVLDDALLATKLKLTIRGGEAEAAGKVAVALPSASASGAANTTGFGAKGYVATAKGSFRDMPVDLRARVGGALPLLQDDTEGQDAPDVPLRVEGTVGAAKLSFDGVGAALLSAHRFDGALRFSGPSLAAVGEPFGVTLPRTPEFDLAGRIGQDAGVWHLRADNATIGSSRLKGDFRYDSTTSPPKLTGELGGSRLLLSDLGPAVGTGGEGEKRAERSTEKGTVPGRVLPNRQFDLPSLRAMDADVKVAIDALDLGTKALAPLRELRTQVLLDAGVLQLHGINAVVAGGTVTGASKLDGTGDPARWAANINFKGLDLAGWIKGVQKADAAASAPGTKPASGRALKQERMEARQGGAQPANAYLTGEILGGFNVTGAGRSTSEILGSLEGSAEATLRDGTISHLAVELAGLDVAQALGVLIRGDQPLPLNCARIDLAIHKGTAVARQAVFDNKDSTIRVAGHIDLRTEGMELVATVRPKDLTLLSLRTPVRVTGTMSDPSIGIEGKGKLAARALAAVALGSVTGGAALLPFVDLGDPEKGDPCAPLPAAAAASGAASGGRSGNTAAARPARTVSATASAPVQR